MTVALPDFEYWRKPRDDWRLQGLHWHGYSWTGSGASYADDAARRDPSTDLPPRVVREWLRKPRQAERPMFRTPEDAVAWARAEWERCGLPVGEDVDIPDETRWGMARHNLQCGLDLMWGEWAYGGSSFVSIAVVGVTDCGVRH